MRSKRCAAQVKCICMSKTLHHETNLIQPANGNNNAVSAMCGFVFYLILAFNLIYLRCFINYKSDKVVLFLIVNLCYVSIFLFIL